MRDQIYSDKLAKLLNDLNEEGFQYVLDKYDLDDLKKIRKGETNEHAKAQLDILLKYWAQAREAKTILEEEIESCWDKDEYLVRAYGTSDNES